MNDGVISLHNDHNLTSLHLLTQSLLFSINSPGGFGELLCMLLSKTHYCILKLKITCYSSRLKVGLISLSLWTFHLIPKE